MPQGKGTYGNKRGRPPKKKRKLMARSKGYIGTVSLYEIMKK